jgi:hypothetical protein
VVTVPLITAGGLTFKTLAGRLRGQVRDFDGNPVPVTSLRAALGDEVATGRVVLDDDGRYSLITSAFRGEELLGLIAFGELPRPEPEASADPLAADLAAVLVVEPVGLSCDVLARRVRRRRSEVLAAVRRDPRFVHQGGRRGSRWRLQDGQGRRLAVPVGLALGQLLLARLRAAENELEALRTTCLGGATERAAE